MAAIKKDRWTGVEQQAPTPKIDIYTKGSSGSPDITFSSDAKEEPWTNLLEYSFSESVDDFEGAFSFVIENGPVSKDGKSVFDLIPLRSVVKIYEGSVEKPAFVGIIRRRHIGMSMTPQGPKRSITFVGKSIISCISEYTISLDVRIQGVADATSKTKTLTAKLAQEGMTITNFMKIAWEHFKEVSEYAGISTTGIAGIINNFIGGDPGTFIEVSGQEKLRYNIACVFYNAADNGIADVWRNILPAPAYEMFSRCNNNGEPKIVARQVPFDPADWSALDIYEISPISLIGYELDQDDEEVYTAFASYIMGSTMSKQFYMATNQTENDSTVVYDKERQKIYGYKPLEITFNGYDRQGNLNDEKKADLTSALKDLNEKAKYWYSRLDEMYSGSITICADFNAPETNPRVGCRAKFLGGEFYIDKTDHAWKYGGTPTIKLSVSRGMKYSSGGDMLSGEEGTLKNVARDYRELDVETN